MNAGSGRTVSTCISTARTPVPNFGTLWVIRLLPNPARPPDFRPLHGWKRILAAVAGHRCALGIGPKRALNTLDPYRGRVTVLAHRRHYPNEAFTISYNLPKSVRGAIVHAFLSPAEKQVTMCLRQRFAHGRRLAAGHARQRRNVELDSWLPDEAIQNDSLIVDFSDRVETVGRMPRGAGSDL